MKKVLHLTTHLNTGGITTYIQNLIEPLRKHDFEISVLSSGGICEQNFRQLHAQIWDFPIKTKSELHPKLYWHLPKIARLCREQKIDILHAHTRVTQVMAFWLGIMTGIPTVTTCHGFYKRRLGRWINPAWGKVAIAISEPVAGHLKNDFHRKPESVCLVHNGINIIRLAEEYSRQGLDAAKKMFGFNPENKVIGMVARLSQDKGHDYLIRAFHVLVKDFPGIRLLIVGDGRERASLETLVHDLGLDKQVVFTGNLMQVAPALAAMDIFVLPATWREGFGLSIIEAMACGKPVIVTNIWALNSLIKDHSTGLLIEPKSETEIIRALSSLLTDNRLCESLGSQGKKMVNSFFSIEHMAAGIAAVYQAVLLPTARHEPKPAEIH